MPPARALVRRTTALLVAVLFAAPGAVRAADPAGPTARAVRAYPLTLITGERVLVQAMPDGRYAVSTPGSSEDLSFQTYHHGEDLYVIPDHAATLVPDVLDRELFNVAELVRTGNHDRARSEVPLLLETTPGADPVLPGVTTRRELESIDAEAAELEKARAREFASSLSNGAPAGVEKIWFDAPVETTLQESVPQVRAPEAWARGFDGTGVRVAVLDTGIDATHPDLSGKVTAARNFTTSTTETDRHGHGTHVASTVAGSGAASNGARKGVAPGASLISGKVLDDTGNGLSSWVIAGMEWAVGEADADIVNMSLGAGPTDGTDPLSQAVNRLSAETGTLFAIAAGNLGPDKGSVSSPGSADAALTVGAVSKSDSLASFSGRGPRTGDGAIKPDITAPGVNIVAARASGTTLGNPVDANYTQAAGTSMATPHVAGAAAILAQRHPSWDADELKPALVTSAVPRPTLSVYQQGGGRVDVTAAIDQPVLAGPAPLSLGAFRWPHGGREPVARPVTFTNLSDTPRTLDLTLDVKHESGTVADPGMVSISTATLTLQPGAAAEVVVRLDTNVGVPGSYGGNLLAQGEGVTVRVPVGFYKEPERYDLVVRGVDLDGAPAASPSSTWVMNVDNVNAFLEQRYFADGVTRFRVPPGSYSLMGSFWHMDAAGKLRRLAWVTNPEIDIGADTEMVLDARQAVPISVSVPSHVTVPRQVKLSQYRSAVAGGTFEYSHIIGFGLDVFATPTQPVTKGRYEFFHSRRLFQPDASGAPSTSTPYSFDLFFAEPGRVPSTMTHVVDPATLARIDTTFHAHERSYRYEAEWRNGFLPYSGSTLDIGFPLDAPSSRADYLSAGDTQWRQSACPKFFSGFEAFLCLTEEASATRQPAERLAQSWLEQPSRPLVLDARHEEGALAVDLSPLTDAAGHPSIAGGSHVLELSESGRVVDRSECACMIAFVPDERTRYSLRFDADHGSPVWGSLGSRSSTVWSFDSGREPPLVPPLLEPQPPHQGPLPLLEVAYDLEVDALNRAPFPSATNGPFPVTVRIARQPQAAPAAIVEARLWASFDDGEQWQEVTLSPLGTGSYRAQITHPPLSDTSGAVSLRVHARDEEGATVDQDLIRAYALAPPTSVAINAGDGAHTDLAGVAWSADRAYAPGSFGYTNATSVAHITTRAIAGTEDDALFRAVRESPGEYRFDGLPRGVYQVDLLFAEIEQGRKAGKRVFDVFAEGQPVLIGHDIAAHAGQFAADLHRLSVTVTDGQLNLRLDPRLKSGAPTIAGIRLVQTEG